MKPETAPRLEDARDALVVLVTCPDEPTAAAIARTVVEEGLAAFGAKRVPDFRDKVSRDMPDFFPWWEEPEFE